MCVCVYTHTHIYTYIYIYVCIYVYVHTNVNLESNPRPTKHIQRGQTLCALGPGDPTDTEPDLCLSVSRRGAGKQWPATAAGALGAEDLGMA